jgi:spermidine synthase
MAIRRASVPGPTQRPTHDTIVDVPSPPDVSVGSFLGGPSSSRSPGRCAAGGIIRATRKLWRALRPDDSPGTAPAGAAAVPQPERVARFLKPLLSLTFFFSGAAALIFETLWFRQAGLAVGNSVWATSLVLASFMAGLALGNALAGRYGDRVRRPLRAFALLELSIALMGTALVFWLPQLGGILAPLFRPLLGHPLALNALRLPIAFGLLLAPAAAMGATLPVLVRALYAHVPQFGYVLGQLYGWNTLGAVVGALAGEVVLVEALGVRGTAGFAALLDVTAATGAFLIGTRTGDTGVSTHAETPARPATSPRARRVLAAAFLSGANLLALEVVWFRFLSMRVGGTAVVQAAMLAMVLLGIALGGLTASLWLERGSNPAGFTRPLALMAGVLTTVTYAAFHVGPIAELTEIWVSWRAVLLPAARLMFPVSFVSGALFTLLGELAHREIRGESEAAGVLTMWNTLGGVTGSLVAGFVLVPVLGMELSLFSLTLSYGGVAALVPQDTPLEKNPRLVTRAALLLFAIQTAFFPFGLMSRHFFAGLALRFSGDGSRLVALREGTSQTVLYFRRDFADLGTPAYYRLATDSVSMSSTALGAARYMKLFVHLPVAIHPAPRRALLISYGVGMTAAALASTSELEEIDVVDTSREILEMSDVVFPDPATHPLKDPRVSIFVEDGRQYLQVTDRSYDLITGEPPPPKTAGVVSLYTLEYFRLIRERLRPGGIASYWLPVHELGVRESRAILRSFCDVFEDCSLWQGYQLDWIMLGTRGAQGSPSLESFTRQWRDPRALPGLQAIGIEVPEQLGAQFLAGPAWLKATTAEVLPLVDDFPRRLSPRLDADWLSRQRAEHRKLLDVEANRSAFEQSPLIRRLWPDALRERTLGQFGLRRLINDQVFWAPPKIDGVDELCSVLEGSTLKSLPLWMLESSVERQRAVAAIHDESPDVSYWRGIGALSERAYDVAAGHFERVLQQRPGDPAVQQLRVLALALGGRRAQLLDALGALDGDVHAPFREWLTERFRLPRSAGDVPATTRDTQIPGPPAPARAEMPDVMGPDPL